MINYFSEIRNLLRRYEAKYFAHPRFVCVKMILRHFKFLFRRDLVPRFRPVKDDKIHILFWLDGGLGDMLIALNFLMHVKDKFKDGIFIDISVQSYLKQEVKRFLEGQTFIRNVWEDNHFPLCYDAFIKFLRFPKVCYACFKKIRPLNPDLADYLDAVLAFQIKYPDYVQYGTSADRILNDYTLLKGRNRVSQADISNDFNVTSKLKIQVSDGARILKKIGLKNNGYIILQTGAGMKSLKKGQILSTREWSVDSFDRLIKLLHQKYPAYQLVQVGYENGCHMKGVDLDLCGKTSFDELLGLLKHAKLLIAGESGNVHFRHFINKAPSVVLFGPTSPEIYGYEENINISAGVCTGCEWINQYWREECLKSDADSFCMRSITPEMVINEIKKHGLLA